MPPKAARKKARVTTPQDAYFERLEKALADHHGKGSMLIKGIEREDEDEDEDEDEEDGTELTAEQVATLRHIIINASRDKALQAGHRFASGGQSDDDCRFATFNTHAGNMVIDGIPGEVKKALKQAKPFDALLGLTHGLKNYDSWMHDNECYEPGGGLEKGMKVLAKAWKDTLKKSDAELGIDSEFTRPGIVSLLEQLEEDFEGCEATCEFKFKWHP